MFLNGIIYKATNTVNSKCYVGQTRQELSSRKADHKRCSKTKDTYFARAIRKHGWESFVWDVIDTYTTVEEGDIKETEQIIRNNSLYYQHGYNILPGGDGFRALHLSEETKKRMSEASKKRWQDPEYKAKMLESHKHRKKPTSTRVISVEEANKRSIRMKQLWQDVDFRDRVHNARKQSITPELRKLRSNQSKSLWQNPEFRLKMSLVKNQSSESLEKRSKSMIQRWKDSEYLRKQSTALRNSQTPEVLEKRRQTLIKRWQDPEYKKTQSEAIKKRWANTSKERRTQICSAMQSARKLKQQEIQCTAV